MPSRRDGASEKHCGGEILLGLVRHGSVHEGVRIAFISRPFGDVDIELEADSEWQLDYGYAKAGAVRMIKQRNNAVWPDECCS